MNKHNILPQEIEFKQKLLNSARQTLKNEFVGIDLVIDKVIDSISTWFIFPHLQEKPVIINLWGMTGVGKTALIIRLSNLLQYDKKFYRYDMGNNSEQVSSLKEVFKELFNQNNGMSCILMLDEFQYAKTKNEQGEEIDNNYSRIIWDLLDSGKFQAFQNNESTIRSIIKVKEICEHGVKLGIVLKDGIVVEKADDYLKVADSYASFEFEGYGGNQYCSYNNETQIVKFLPKFIIPDLYYYLREPGLSILHFHKKIESLTAEQTLNLLNKVLEIAQSNKWIDCSKSLIFLIGNLDEAYSMSSAFNPDISADEFHESSLKININHIKLALKKRFRNEQISRLGNNHIIYPAFNEYTFKEIIKRELNKISLTIKEQFSVSLSFTSQFEEVLYNEGVYPTQGTRPLFSTIYQFVNSKIPKLISEILLREKEVETILFNATGNTIHYHFKEEEKVLFSIDELVELNLEKLRRPTHDDYQAITAVHESGHTIVSIVASNKIPEYVCSTSSDTQSSGFMVSINNKKYLSKQELLQRIAIYMGGLLAEKIVFGEECMTCGAESDLHEATALASSAVKECGFGNLMAKINVASFQSSTSYHDLTGEYNSEVKTLIEEGCRLAESILKEENNLLLALSDYLSDERIIKKDKIAELVSKYGSTKIKDTDFENGNFDTYRAVLKSKVKNICVKLPVTLNTKESLIVLNKIRTF